MMRGLYPKNDLGWTNEEKRRYWSALKTLLHKADVIEKNSGC